VGKAFPGGLAAAIDIFTCGEEGRLETFTHASRANISANRQWLLHDIEQKIFTGYEINTKKLTNLTLDSFLTSAQVEVLQLPPDTMSGSDLYRYIRALRERGQNADTYALALWQKITLPVATGAMILLSLTFVFGPPRERTTGFRIMMGSIVGVAFFLANQLMGRMGLVMDLNPAFTTLSPVAVILFSAFWLLRRLP